MKTFEILEFDKILNLLADNALSDGAKKRILNLKPYLNETEVNIKMNETTEAKSIINNFGNPPLPIMKDIDKIDSIIDKNSILIPEQLLNIAQFLVSCKRTKAYLKKSETQISLYANSIDSLDDLVSEIENSIKNNTVDDNASPILKSVRRKIEITISQIKLKLENILRNKREYFADNYYTIKDDCYTLPVKKEYKNQISGTVINISNSGSTYFIEPSTVKKLKDELYELKIVEENEIKKVLYTLTSLVEDYLQTIKINIEAIEILDFIFAKAKLSIKMNANPVTINSDRSIIINSGMHPLLDSQNVVPIDFKIGDGINGVIITGPNTGGKTVALKTVGLLSIMVQSGLHVPVANGSKFTMNNTILCDIGDGQSISESLSTFSAHIKNIIEILNSSDNESLILLDELGSGTDPTEGMGIAIAILEELKNKNCLFVATTHYPEVKEYAKITDSLVNAKMEFDAETLKPLYKLIIGEAGESCALYIAQRLGLSEHMLKRAYYESYKENTDKFSNALEQTNFKTISHIKKSKPITVKNKFSMGDSVMVYPQKLIGIVYEPENDSGEIIVQIKGKKMKAKAKRVKLITPATELYPPDYDFSIIFDTVENRKARHQMTKKHNDDIRVVYEVNNIN